MILSDLLLTHSVMYLIDARNEAWDASYLTYSSCYNLEDYIIADNEHFSAIVSLFQFDSEVSVSSESTPFGHQLFYNNAVTFEGHSATAINSDVRISSTQDQNDKVRVRVSLCFPNIATLYSSMVYIDVGKTYGLTTMFAYINGTSCSLVVHLMEYDAYGNPTTIAYTGGIVSNITTNGGLPYRLKSRLTFMNDFVGQVRLYEIMLLGLTSDDDVDVKVLLPRLWSGLRRLIHTYSNPNSEAITYFMLPPYAIMDGSGYDRSSILLDEIDTLQGEVDLLSAELEDGGTFFDWLAEKLNLAWDFYTAIFDDDPETPGIKWDVIDNTLCKVINSAFNAVEEIF